MFWFGSPKRIGKWPPEIAVSSWSLHPRISRGELKIVDFPRFAKKEFGKLGVSCLEVVVNHLLAEDERDMERLASEAKQAGMRTICLALSNDFTRASDLDREVAETKRFMKVAKALGAPIVRVNPGMRGEDPDEEQATNVAEGLRRLLRESKKLGVLLALENHQLFGLNPANTLRVLRILRWPRRVGVCLDFGNFYPENRDSGPRELAPHAIHAHAKAYSFDADGNEKTIKYLDRLRELKKAGFKGFISVEWEGKQGEDDIENTRHAIRLIQRCLKKLS